MNGASTGNSLTIYLKFSAPISQLLENILVVNRAEMVRCFISLGFLAFDNKGSSPSILDGPKGDQSQNPASLHKPRKK
jgi:hypothetical protein